MSTNKFNRDALNQINEIEKSLNEGFIGNTLMRIIFGGKAKKVMKKAVKAAKDDPEVLAAFQGLKYHHDKLKDLVDTFCDRYPEAKSCK